MLSGCQVNKTYDDLNNEFQNHLDDYHEIYQKRIDFFNVASTTTVQSIVMINVSIKPTNQLIKASGVVFDQSSTHYYVLTNHHVVETKENETATYRIQDYLGNLFNASLVYTDPNYDLAILSFPKISRQIQIITFSEQNPKLKDHIVIMGYPNIHMIAMTMGTVINYGKISLNPDNTSTINISFEVIITYAPVKPGSSGSLVINENHELVGIVFSAHIPREVSDATFIIPVIKVLEFIASAKAGGWL